MAFRYATPPKLGNSVKARSMSSSPPKKRVREKEAFLGRRITLQGRGHEDTGDHSNNREGLDKSPLQNKRTEQLKYTGGAGKFVGKDGPNTSMKLDGKAVLERGKRYSPARKAGGPGKGHPKIEMLQEIYKIVKELVSTIWWFVAPVFNPDSAFRRRWARQELTWQDIILIGGTGILGVGTFLAGALCARVVAMALLILRLLIGTFKTVVGL
jgi:hypothetical protein